MVSIIAKVSRTPAESLEPESHSPPRVEAKLLPMIPGRVGLFCIGPQVSSERASTSCAEWRRHA